MKLLLQLLTQYTLFQDDKVLELSPLIRQGHCNQNYLLHTEKARYVLRVFGEEKRDRALEYRIQSLAYKKGLAAQPIQLDMTNNLMISAFVEGEHKKSLSET